MIVEFLIALLKAGVPLDWWFIFKFNAAEEPEPVLEHEHAKQEDRHAGRDLLEIRTDPEPVVRSLSSGR